MRLITTWVGRIAKSGARLTIFKSLFCTTKSNTPIQPINFYGRPGRGSILRPIFTPKKLSVKNNHISYNAPIVIDARMKPWYPKEVEAREDIVKLVDSRWHEYFPLKA